MVPDPLEIPQFRLKIISIDLCLKCVVGQAGSLAGVIGRGGLSYGRRASIGLSRFEGALGRVRVDLFFRLAASSVYYARFQKVGTWM